MQVLIDVTVPHVRAVVTLRIETDLPEDRPFAHHRYSNYSFYWYKRTDSDAEGGGTGLGRWARLKYGISTPPDALEHHPEHGRTTPPPPGPPTCIHYYTHIQIQHVFILLHTHTPPACIYYYTHIHLQHVFTTTHTYTSSMYSLLHTHTNPDSFTGTKKYK
jgi:hypothetical protein